MKNAPLALALIASLLAVHAYGQGATPSTTPQPVTYTISGTFDSSVPTTSLTAPGDFFRVVFTVPGSVLTKSPTELLAPIQSGYYEWGTVNGSTSHGNLTSDSIYDYRSNAGTDINIASASGDQVELAWTNSAAGFIGSLASPADANGVATFKTGDFGTTGINSFSFYNNVSGEMTILFGQSATITGAAPAPIPEPSMVGMMVIGLLSCGGFVLMRRRHTV